MAFNFTYLSRIENTGGNLDRTLNERSGDVKGVFVDCWTYNATALGSNESSATVQTAGYFLPATGYLKVGDFIFISCNDPVSHVLNVATNTGAALTTTQVA